MLSAGAWPQPAIVDHHARAGRAGASPRRSRAAAGRSSRRAGTAPGCPARPSRPTARSRRVVGELLHHRRVVVRRHAAVGQAARRGLGQAPPLRVAQPAVGLVDGAEVLLQLAHASQTPPGCRRSCGCAAMAASASCGPMSLSTSRRMRPRSAPAAATSADRAAHRGAEPVAALDAQLVEQRRGQLRRRTPGSTRAPGSGLHWLQAAADGVGADHAVALRQVRRDVVHVAPGARQAVPGDHGLAVLRAPLGVVELAACAGEVVRA